MRMSNHDFRRLKNYIAYFLVYLSLILALSPLFSIIVETAHRGISALNLDFFTMPTPTVGEANGGVANAIQGTLITIGLASLIGIPIGIFSGIFLSEHGETKLASTVRLLNEVLNGVPSIIIGIFSYSLIVLSLGFSVIAASLALSIIMIPIITRTTEEAMKLIPTTIREAALALGVPWWKTIVFVLLKSAEKGIATGVLLSVARIAGESAPILVTMGFWRWWFTGLNRPAANLALNVFIFANSPFENWVLLAWGSALVLMILVSSINMIVRIFIWRD
ncbi:MAG: phosphate ABC transporter permease PstA [Thermoproteota archaeon]